MMPWKFFVKVSIKVEISFQGRTSGFKIYLKTSESFEILLKFN